MTPIDLIPYVESSRKVPRKLLAPVSKEKAKPIETWQLLVSHFCDFSAVFMFSCLMATMFDLSVDMLMLTKQLRSAYAKVEIFNLSMAFLPISLFCYFFTSYLMNHGQTWGMYLMKKRLVMDAYSVKDSFSWATHSFLLCLSGGISFLLNKTRWKGFKAHDHLYSELFLFKESKVINLVEKVEEFEEVPEEYSQAA